MDPDILLRHAAVIAEIPRPERAGNGGNARGLGRRNDGAGGRAGEGPGSWKLTMRLLAAGWKLYFSLVWVGQRSE